MPSLLFEWQPVRAELNKLTGRKGQVGVRSRRFCILAYRSSLFLQSATAIYCTAVLEMICEYIFQCSVEAAQDDSLWPEHVKRLVRAALNRVTPSHAYPARAVRVSRRRR